MPHGLYTADAARRACSLARTFMASSKPLIHSPSAPTLRGIAAALGRMTLASRIPHDRRFVRLRRTATRWKTVLCLNSPTFPPDVVRFYNAGVSSYGTVHVLANDSQRIFHHSSDPYFYMYYLNDTRWDNIQADATTVMDGYLTTVTPTMAKRAFERCRGQTKNSRGAGRRTRRDGYPSIQVAALRERW